MLSFRSHLKASTMLAPSGISAPPLSKASANSSSFSAVLYEWALIVFINNLPSGNTDKSLLCFRSETVLSFNMFCEKGMGGYKYATLLPVTKNRLSNDVVRISLQRYAFSDKEKNFIEKRYLCILFSCGVPFLCYCDNTFLYRLIICLALLSHDSSS